MRILPLIIAIALALGSFGTWAFFNQPVSLESWEGALPSVAYSPYQADQDPRQGAEPQAAMISRDLDLLARHGVRRLRTYSMQDGNGLIAAHAARQGMTVSAGAWIDGAPESDREELNGLIRLARLYPNVRSLLVGNEAILRDDVAVETLVDYLNRVRQQVAVPVSTAEPWWVWLRYPQLAEASDYLAVHVLPYWEGVPVEEAPAYVLRRYRELQARYPDKHIVLTEVGWPSAGPWRQAAQTSRTDQARFIRSFLNLAQRQGVDFYVMEAFDQPWKWTLEGRAGAAWGLFNVERDQKFPMVGPVLEHPEWSRSAAASSLLGLTLMMLWMLGRRRAPVRPSGIVICGLLLQASAAALVVASEALSPPGVPPLTQVSWAALYGALLLLLLVVICEGIELVELLWPESRRRPFAPVEPATVKRYPKVSIHVPTYNEPPDMVIETLDALAALEYPDFEVIIVDNNTTDPALYRPVKEHCRRLGSSFRFFHLPRWPGYKAGALNFALAQTATDAEVVAVVDSDYVVDSGWLAGMVPHFEDRRVGLVQSPQAYRAWERRSFTRYCHWEYAGFFQLGMVRRNDDDAIIQHGTMTLVRRRCLEELGGWAEWCITEDAELGLRLLSAGYQSVYAPNCLGRGLVPSTFAAYNSQRFRWAYGAVQILKRHWRTLWLGRGELDLAQRYHFITGWLPWLVDGLHLLFAAVTPLWVLYLLARPENVEFPPVVFAVPILATFVFKLARTIWLYGARVACQPVDCLRAAVAGMALTYIIGRAVLQGLVTSNQPFVRTPKCEGRPAMLRGLLMARGEAVLAGLLIACAAAIAWQFGGDNRQSYVWSALLLVHALPYLAALGMAGLSIAPELTASVRTLLTKFSSRSAWSSQQSQIPASSRSWLPKRND